LGHATDEELATVAGEVAAEIEEAVRFAEDSPSPAPEDCLKHVFAEEGSR